jgi:hypothetical protein
MSDDRKKPLWPCIVALLIGLPVLYVVSFGPACWIMSRTRDQQLPDGYMPIGWLMSNSPRFVGESIAAYAEAGIPLGSHVYLPDTDETVIEMP